jgi:hypothetical protein
LAIEPKNTVMFYPPGLAKFKKYLFDRIAERIVAQGGDVLKHDFDAVYRLPRHAVPIIGCSPRFRKLVHEWPSEGRPFIFWDRGYLRRVFATWLPQGYNGGYYRWTINAPQMKEVREYSDDRWKALRLEGHVVRWRKGGREIVIADTGPDYWDLFADREWSARVAEELRRYTDRPIRIRPKESTIPLDRDLAGAFALVTHGSIAAVEAVVFGVPVFVDKQSAAAPMGLTDFTKIESPVYPDRDAWLRSLAYSQYNETELVDGTLFRLLW